MKRKRTSSPLMLFWSKRDQRRFIDAVERFQSLVNDLDAVMVEAKLRSAARRRPRTKEVNGKNENAVPSTSGENKSEPN